MTVCERVYIGHWIKSMHNSNNETLTYSWCVFDCLFTLPNIYEALATALPSPVTPCSRSMHLATKKDAHCMMNVQHNAVGMALCGGRL